MKELAELPTIEIRTAGVIQCSGQWTQVFKYLLLKSDVSLSCSCNVTDAKVVS